MKCRLATTFVIRTSLFFFDSTFKEERIWRLSYSFEKVVASLRTQSFRISNALTHRLNVLLALRVMP